MSNQHAALRILRRALASGVLATAMMLASGSGCGERAAASPTHIAAVCAARCDWLQRCVRGDAACVDNCTAESQGYSGKVRADFMSALASCFQSHPCGQSDDACFSRAIIETVPDHENHPVLAECHAVRQGCRDADEPTFSDDYCGTALALTSGALAEYRACYQRPCAEQSACIKSVLGPRPEDDEPPAAGG